VRSRLTPLGWGFTGLAFGLTALAWRSANPLLFLALAFLLALLLVEHLLGARNLRGVEAGRRLPDDLFAGRPLPGALALRRGSEGVPSRLLRLEERGEGSRVHVSSLAAGAEALPPFSWRFARRGRQRLGPLLVSSEYPFGLVRRERRLQEEVEVLVWPEPGDGDLPLAAEAPESGDARSEGTGGSGDLLEIRDFRPGDPPSRVHWPSSARHGRRMLAVREGERRDAVLLRVPEEMDPRHREDAIRRAATGILRHAARGHVVGLVVDGHGRWPPQAGDPWRRALLDALALLPDPFAEFP
jgi:uncharacterized protein (DUF58 family)